MILACCMSPARSPAEARNRMLETANRMLGMAIAAITITTNKTINSSMMLNPPLRSRRGCFLLGSILILVSNLHLGAYCQGSLRAHASIDFQIETRILDATPARFITLFATATYGIPEPGFRFERKERG